MSETTNTPDESVDQVPSEASDPLQGYVPESELERERLRTRSFQAERDRLAAELAKLQAPQKEQESVGTSLQGFDPDEFRTSVARDAYHAVQMARKADSLRDLFPFADETLFSPERVAQFRDVESFELAVSDSHSRVAKIAEAERAKAAEELRKEMSEKYGVSVSSTPGSAADSVPSGDPTPEQLARMTSEQWQKLDPEVIDRVLARAANQ